MSRPYPDLHRVPYVLHLGHASGFEGHFPVVVMSDPAQRCGNVHLVAAKQGNEVDEDNVIVSLNDVLGISHSNNNAQFVRECEKAESNRLAP